MKLNASCSDDQLQVLLQSESDEDSAEFRSAVAHVEHCDSCQARLTELAAEDGEWDEAHEMLVSVSEMRKQGDNQPRTGTWNAARQQQRPAAWTDSMARQVLSPPSHPEMLGRIGRFDVERLIGAGGMGVVFKAFDTELNRPVAIKVLAPFLAGNGAGRQRFAREARAAAAVVHEHVVAIHNVETDGESPFFVMPYVAGESLQTRLDREGSLDVCEVLRIGTQTAAGLAAAHAQGLVHRDVKPSNILLEEGVERSLLTDFGLARANDDASLTSTGYHLGTPQYMSPEQARGDAVDARSDLFSLGSVLYFLATGRVPFRAENAMGVLRKIDTHQPLAVRSINHDISPQLESLIEWLMHKNPQDRPNSAEQFQTVCEGLLAHRLSPTKSPIPAKLRQPRRQTIRFDRALWVSVSIALMIGAAFWIAKARFNGPQQDPQAADPITPGTVTPGTSTAEIDASPEDGHALWPQWDDDLREMEQIGNALNALEGETTAPIRSTIEPN